MLLQTTFILLALATARIAVCAPVEGNVTRVVIGSDDGLVNPIREEKAASSASGNVVSTGGGRCKGSCACGHAKISKPEKIYIKSGGSPVGYGSSQDAIPTNAFTEKKSVVPKQDTQSTFGSVAPPPTPATSQSTTSLLSQGEISSKLEGNQIGFGSIPGSISNNPVTKEAK